MLNILETYDLKTLGHNSAEHLHLMIEAKKLAFADRDAYIADPDKASVPVARLISKEYARERRRLLSETHATPAPGPGLRENGVSTARWEKRNLALEIPAWDTTTCIQCGKCAMVCPHSVIRIKVYDGKLLASAPETFKATDARDKEWAGMKYTIQVAPEDCTGCGISFDICPAKNKTETRLKAINMVPQPALRESERNNGNSLKLPELDRRNIKISTIRQQQVQEPLFNFLAHARGVAKPLT